MPRTALRATDAGRIIHLPSSAKDAPSLTIDEEPQKGIEPEVEGTGALGVSLEERIRGGVTRRARLALFHGLDLICV